MQQAASAKAPMHLWIVGILSLIWNCIGGYDYVMTRTHNMAYLGSTGGDPNAILAYIDKMSLPAAIGWGLGVWGALLGSVLLLMRSRFAVHAFAASLLGAVVSFGAQYLGPPSPMHDGPAKYMPLIIIALAIAQLWYAMRETKTGVLR